MLTRRKLIAGGACLAGAAALAAVPFVRRRAGRNVLFIIADALRADRILCDAAIDGRPQALMPNLRRLYGSGLAFSSAVAPSSWTPVCVGCILHNASPFDARYSPSDGWSVAGQTSLPREAAQLGYQTSAFSANALLDAPIIRSAFDHLTILAGKRAAPNELASVSGKPSCESLNEHVIAFLDAMPRSRPFFAYVHYMDTHEVYYTPFRVLTRFGTTFNGEIFPTRVNNYIRRKAAALPHVAVHGVTYEDTELSPVPMATAIAELRTYYNAAAMALDAGIAALLDRLDAQGLLDDTLVVISADHGEKLADDTEEDVHTFGHAQGLTQEELRVPLIIWRKGDPVAVTIDRTVGSSAVLNAFIRGYLRGRSTGETIAEAEYLGPAVSYLNWSGFNGFSVVSGQTKVTGRFSAELDPVGVACYGVSMGAASDKPVLPAEDAERAISDAIALVGRRATQPLDAAAMSVQDRERLRALGYLGQ